jgi:phospholipid/cholesterol/gamma-HCH transport system ATP-binding protein
MGDAAISFLDVHKRYGDLAPAQGLSFEVSPRGLTFLTGRSGAGKSVLCRLAVGLTRPDKGEVTLLGQRLAPLNERALRALRRQAPYVVQAAALLDHLSVRENVALGAEAKAADEALEALGLNALAGRPPTDLSPGLRKKVAIARALARKPSFVLLDEPTTGLDPAGAAQVGAALATFREAGLGALVVSHDQALIGALADRVMRVDAGRVT